MLILGLTLSLLTSCGSGKNDSQVPDGSGETIGSEIDDESDAAAVSWDLETIDPETELPVPALKTEVSTPKNVESLLFDSPVKFTDAQTVVDKINGSHLFDDCSFYTEKQENTEATMNYKDIGEVAQIVRTDVINGYRKENNSPVVSLTFVRPLFSHDGCADFHLYVYETEMTKDFQKKLADLLTEIIGSDLSHVLLYMKDESYGGNDLNKKVTKETADGVQASYELTRNVSEKSLDVRMKCESYNVNFSEAKYFKYYTGSYKTITDDMKYSIPELFKGKLGSTVDFRNPNNTLTDYMQHLSKNAKTVYDSYSYKIRETADGCTYDLDATWKRCEEGESPVRAAGLRIAYVVCEDKNGDVKTYSYTIEGAPKDVDMQSDHASKMTAYKELLDRALDEVRFVFGDNVDYSAVSLDKFSTVTDSEDGQQIPVDKYAEASMDLFGKEDKVMMKFTMKNTFSDSMSCVWTFTCDNSALQDVE